MAAKKAPQARKAVPKKKSQKTAHAVPLVVASPVDMRVSFPMVGIGASAGGLESFEKLFTHLPPDSGMAFIIVQYFDPTQESVRTDLLKRFTHMLVTQVAQNTVVEANRVYVIPPSANLELRGGVLQLVKPTMPRGLRLPIDHFFRSLAADQGEKAICIILSGTGTDGTLGMKAIKEEGGLAIVESPESALYDGMPLSAINTGLVDMVLPPEEIAQQLMDYFKRFFEPGARQNRQFMPGLSDHLQSIFSLLKAHTGHDFSGYKETTIARRIERRMTVNQMGQVEDYVRYLQTSPLEIASLLRELLIGVTSFFRDRGAFEYLEEKVIPGLFADTRENPRMIRVWIPGCSTGEEAYSVAMLLLEKMEKVDRQVEIQIFATDIDQTAILKAREGRYLDSIAADVPPERLNRFFTQEEADNAYQVKRQIRDTVVFAVQSIIKDPPFSKLDLICCRNLMIYLGPELQQKLLSLFHYALNRGGVLFLGNSETLGNSQKLFRTMDQRWKIFERVEFVSDIRTVLEFSGHAKRDAKALVAFPEKQMSVREVTEQMLLADYVPTSVLINERAEMLYIVGHTGKYLEQSTGEASTNILQIAREGLRMPLSTAIRNASTQKKQQTIEAVSVKIGHETIRVQLSVAPVVKPTSMQGLMLVTFTEMSAPSAATIKQHEGIVDDSHAQHMLELEQELKSTREYLQTVIEELETTNEELKSSNGELQSSNEELQSTNEELQASKEELQSVNEELVTVNTALQSKVDELTFANNDVKNLMESVQVGIIFLDLKLQIRRFTQASKLIVDLIPEDVGRPLKQFVHKLRYDGLIQDAQETLKTQKTKEVEVQTEGGTVHILRIMPYRTMDEQLSGVVLTLTDITQSKLTEEARRKSDERFRAISSSTPDHILMQDRDLRYEFVVNPQVGLTEQDMLGKTDHDFLAKEDADKLTQIKMQVLESGKPFHLEIPVRSREGVEGHFEGSFIPRFDAYGKVTGLIGYFKDVTARVQAEEGLRKSEETYRLLFARNPNPMWVFDEGTLQFLAVNDAAIKCYGWSRQEFQGLSVLDVRPIEDRALAERLIKQHQNAREAKAGINRHRKKDGTVMFMEVNVSSITYEGRPARLCSMNDITERVQAQESLRESEARAQAMLQAVPDLVFHMNRAGVILHCKAEPKDLDAQSEATLVGKHHRDIFPAEIAALIDQKIQDALNTSVMQTFEYQWSTSGGGVQVYEARMVPSGADEVIAIVRDITEKVRAESEQQAYKQQTLEAQRLQSLGLLAGGVAHDLNNLLTPIWNSTELLRAACGTSPDTIEQWNAISAATERARDLVLQMLAYAGRRPTTLAYMELNGLITESQTLLRASLPKNVSIHLEISAEPLPIFADHTHLQQVVMNLMLNAAESFAGNGGQIFVTTRREEGMGNRGEEVVLSVRDTGPGIAPEHLPRIFDPFFTTKTTGHGLGLSATQGIIRAHNGSLAVESVVGEGTTFTIRLPLGESLEKPKGSPPPTVSMAQPEGGLWLVIDDEAIVRTSTCRVLQHMKLRTIDAGDGARGLVLAREHADELRGVVLDLTMPRMSGREVLQHLRAEFPALPVLLLSGYTGEEVKDLVALPKVVFLPKPYTMQTLRQAVRGLLESS